MAEDFFYFILFFCILALARLPIPTWSTYCIEGIEGQSTHSNKRKHYKKLSTLAVGNSQFSLLILKEKSCKCFSRQFVGQNTAKEKGLVWTKLQNQIKNGILWTKFQQTLSDRETQEIRQPNQSSASMLTTCHIL